MFVRRAKDQDFVCIKRLLEQATYNVADYSLDLRSDFDYRLMINKGFCYVAESNSGIIAIILAEEVNKEIVLDFFTVAYNCRGFSVMEKMLTEFLWCVPNRVIIGNVFPGNHVAIRILQKCKFRHVDTIELIGGKIRYVFRFN